MDTSWLDGLRTTLEQERWIAELDHTDIRLRRGEHARLLPALTARVEQHPLDERAAGQVMLACYRSGRQADALYHYQQIAHRLADELGTDPGPALQQLHQQILTADPTLLSRAIVSAPVSAPVPRQLPAPPRLFTGRHTELDHLSEILTGSHRHATAITTMAITVITGTGGIGKTALALHWAHHHADQFPDGQLFVNLRGFDPTGQAVSPQAALRGFLHALGADASSLPADLAAQAALYRSLIAGRRMLILLDNAVDTAQVTPLLPGSPTCTAVITSRHTLTGLGVHVGAHLVDLDTLPNTDARALLAAHLDTDRLATEPQATGELVRFCAGLPLALRITAARAAAHPDFPLAALVEDLRDARTRLDALDGGDLTTDLRAVFASSYHALDPDTAHLFALLGLMPGPDISTDAAANLVGWSSHHTRQALQRLEHAHLAQQHTHARYRMHDLTSLYATEQAHRELNEPARQAARRRIVDFYLHTAYRAHLLLVPVTLQPIEVAAPVSGCTPHPLDDQAAAMRWFDAEYACLLATQRLVSTLAWQPETWQLGWTLVNYQWRRGYVHDHVAVLQTAVDAVDRIGDPAASIRIHRMFGAACVRVGRHTDALNHLRCALTAAERADDHFAQANTHYSLSYAFEQQARFQEALDHAYRGLRLFRMVGNRAWEAATLTHIAEVCTHMRDLDRARIHSQAALRLHRQYEVDNAEADTLDCLGRIAHHDGQYTHALGYFHQALTIYRRLGHDYDAASTLDRVGDLHVAFQQHTDARETWQQALTLYREQLRTTEAGHVQRKLDSLNDRSKSPSTPIWMSGDAAPTD